MVGLHDFEDGNWPQKSIQNFFYKISSGGKSKFPKGRKQSFRVSRKHSTQPRRVIFSAIDLETYVFCVSVVHFVELTPLIFESLSKSRKYHIFCPHTGTF